MEIKLTEFVKSSANQSQCPEPKLPEYAFIGRSNVGKSSLINMLTQRKDLAKISGRPGKTQLINHFLINKEWYLVDLPGFGYARVSKKLKATFGPMIQNYLMHRENLMCTFHLIDSRHEPQPNDLEFMQWLGERGLAFCIVFTKTDKLTPTKLEENIEAYKKRLLEDWEELPPIFLSSASHKTGRDEILKYIHEVSPLFKQLS